MDKDTRIMTDRQRALEYLKKQQQERLDTALKAWQPFFAQQTPQPQEGKQTLNLRSN